MPDEVICCPSTYSSRSMQNYIKENRTDHGQKWIFDLIDMKYRSTEIILMRTAMWTLCRDAQNTQNKWLVVFHDTSLHSIRDLRASHIQMLLDSQQRCQTELERRNIVNHTNEVLFFFHYHPSVYQLHMHVYVQDMSNSESKPHIRRHLLQQVVRNLLQDSDYYVNAMILTALPKSLRNLKVFNTIFDNLEYSSHGKAYTA